MWKILWSNTKRYCYSLFRQDGVISVHTLNARKSLGGHTKNFAIIEVNQFYSAQKRKSTLRINVQEVLLKF